MDADGAAFIGQSEDEVCIGHNHSVRPLSVRRVKFAMDSLLEGSGFEPSVPRRGQHFFEAPRNPARKNRPGSQNLIVMIDKGRFTVRRAGLAPPWISKPGHGLLEGANAGPYQPCSLFGL
jgi:hypothetical protein